MAKRQLLPILFILCLTSWAYGQLFDANDPTNLGSTPAIFDGRGIPSTSTRWKSVRVQATTTAMATHFIIRVGSSGVGAVPVGFAVYAGTPAYSDPIGRLLIRGYYPSYNFTQPGYYAFPFTSDSSLQINAGTYYHLVYLLTPENEGAASGWRVDSPLPPKWGSQCNRADCDANMPPGVGMERWSIFYGQPSSASWAMGLLSAEGNGVGPAPNPPTGLILLLQK
jgi:hypothetical protein